LSQGLSSEISSRISGNSSLSQGLSSEISSRISYDSSLSQGLSSEISSRISYDSSLSQGLSDEVFARVFGNSSLEQGLNNEVFERVSGDLSLAQALSSEIFSRISADTDVNATSVTTDTLLVTNNSTLNDSLVLRNSNVTTNQLNVSVDELQNISFFGKSSTDNTNVLIKYHCDTVTTNYNGGSNNGGSNNGGSNNGGSNVDIVENLVMTLAPTYIEVNRPITFNYLTSPTINTQLGYYMSGTIEEMTNITAGTVVCLGENLILPGTWVLNVSFTIEYSSQQLSTFSYGVNNTPYTLPTIMPYKLSFFKNILTNSIGSMSVMTNLTLSLSQQTNIYYVLSSDVELTTASCSYSYVRIA